MIISLKVELGNRWKVMAERINGTFGTEWSANQVQKRFLQLETERKQGGRKYRKVIWTADEDARFLALRVEYIKKNESTYGMWDAILTKMQGKTKIDLKHRWEKLSQSSAVTSTTMTSTAATLTAETSTAESTKVVSLKVAATKVPATKVPATKVPASKVAATKVAPPQVIGGLSEYELRREQRIARNNARLAELGFSDKPKEAKKVAKKRKSPPVDEPRKVLPNRKRKSLTYSDDYVEDVYYD
jgi:hypothetical protein